MKRKWFVGLVLGLLAVGSNVALAQEEEEKKKPKRSRNVITAEEIAERGDFQTAFDAIRRLRPAFLRVRGVRSSSEEVLKVYIDGMAEEGTDILKSIPASAVLEVRRLTASEAQFRYGQNHLYGAIVLTTRRSVLPPG